MAGLVMTIPGVASAQATYPPPAPEGDCLTVTSTGDDGQTRSNVIDVGGPYTIVGDAGCAPAGEECLVVFRRNPEVAGGSFRALEDGSYEVTLNAPDDIEPGEWVLAIVHGDDERRQTVTLIGEGGLPGTGLNVIRLLVLALASLGGGTATAVGAARLVRERRRGGYDGGPKLLAGTQVPHLDTNDFVPFADHGDAGGTRRPPDEPDDPAR